MKGNEEFGYRLVWAVDVEKYSSRVARAQLLVQRGLSEALTNAARVAGLDRTAWYTEPRGDGELAVLPIEVDVAAAVGGFARQLAAALAALNDGEPERLRLRLAMHYGTLALGPLGYAGQAPIVVSRLLDSRPLRQILRDHPDRDLALAVSGGLYDDVIATGFCALDPQCFQSFRINVEGTIHQGYVYQPSPRQRRETMAVAGDDGVTADRHPAVLSLNRSAN